MKVDEVKEWIYLAENDLYSAKELFIAFPLDIEGDGHCSCNPCGCYICIISGRATARVATTAHI